MSKTLFRPWNIRRFQTDTWRHRTTSPEIRDLLERAIEDNPPATLKEGGLIKRGFDATLDRFREIGREGKGWIADLEAKERMRTGISSLKVRYNRVFGYYIEVTKPNLASVPPPLHPQADPGQRRTVHHPGTPGIRDPGPPGGRADRSPGVSALPRGPETGRREVARLPGDRPEPGGDRRPLSARGRGGPVRLRRPQ